MASTLAAQSAASNDLLFIQRVQAALVAACVAIQNEATTTANHLNRATYAKTVLNNPTSYAPLFALAVASQGIDATSPDSQITNTLSAVFNALAGTL